MLLSAVSVLVVAQLNLEIPEGLVNYPVHSNSSCTNASQCYIVRTLPVMFHQYFISPVNIIPAALHTDILSTSLRLYKIPAFCSVGQ